MESKKIIISIDFEKPFYRIKEGLNFLLAIFDKYNIKATFFVTEDIIDENMDLVLNIKEKRHEIAYHGFHIPYFQKNIYNMSRKDISDELVRAKQKLLDKGINARGFRAQGLSINREVLNEVAKHFIYDSSLSNSDKSGLPVYTLSNGLIEFSVMRIFNLIRFYPFFLIYVHLMFLVKIIEISPSPVVLYFHVFDFMKKSGKNQGKISWHKQVLYYNWVGENFCIKLEKMIFLLKSKDYSFLKMEDFLK